MTLWEGRPPCEQTDASENITFRQLRLRTVIKTPNWRRDIVVHVNTFMRFFQLIEVEFEFPSRVESGATADKVIGGGSYNLHM